MNIPVAYAANDDEEDGCFIPSTIIQEREERSQIEQQEFLNEIFSEKRKFSELQFIKIQNIIGTNKICDNKIKIYCYRNDLYEIVDFLLQNKDYKLDDIELLDYHFCCCATFLKLHWLITLKRV